MFVFHIVMMSLFGTRIIDNAQAQGLLALVLGVILALASIVHKQKNKWKWPGASIKGLLSAFINLIVIYAFFAYAAYAMQSGVEFPIINIANINALIEDSWVVIIKSASIPVFTPWYLAGIGIGVFNVLASLRLVSTKKSEFESQCTCS